MDISLRSKQLNSLFSYDKKTELEESHLEIIPFRFTQTRGASEIDEFQKGLTPTGFCPMTDDRIQENKSFSYAIFTPTGRKKNNEAIILLHGLNERTWEKYLTWAEYLTHTTGKPVILFPIAFHMNRTPGLWANPRAILPWVSKRKEEIANVTNSTFANVALSSRLSQNPLRFYASGRESVYNMWQLVHEIKNGEHPCSRKIHPLTYSLIPSGRYSRRSCYWRILTRCLRIPVYSCFAVAPSSVRWMATPVISWTRRRSPRFAITSGMISWRTVRFPPRSRMIFWSKPLKPWYVRMSYEITGSRSSNGLAIVFVRSL